MSLETTPQTAGDAKIAEYIKRIRAGKSKEEVIQGLPRGFVAAIEQGLASETEVVPESNVVTLDSTEDDLEQARKRQERLEADDMQLDEVRQRLGMNPENILEKYIISLPNLDEVIEKGGGQLEVFSNEVKVEFEELAVGVDKENGTAEVLFIRKKDQTTNRGIGVPIYIELAKRLAEKGITLWSSNAQYDPGRNLWSKLAKLGLVDNVNGGFRFKSTL